MGAILDSLDRWVWKAAPREALVSRGEGCRRTFGQLATRLEAWQARLQQHGLTAAVGGPVAVATGNGVAFVELVLALWRLDVPVVAMDGGLSQAEQRALCQRLGVSHWLHRGCEGAPFDLDGCAGAPVRLSTVETTPSPLPAGTRLIKLTSGSTGEPVGLLFDFESLAAGIRQIGEGMGLTEDDRVLLALPLSHSYGFDNGLLSLAVLGTPLILEPSKFPAPLLRALAESRATFLPLVPPLVRSLGRVTWPDGLALRRVICAGGVLQPEAAEAFHRASGRRVHDFYGSTETGGIAFESEPEHPRSSGTVGRPLPGVCVDLEGDRQVVVRSAANRLGVLGDPSLVDRRVVSGDLGELTPCGRLRLVGRSADFLDIGGRKVSAASIEAALVRLPGVREAAVVGLADPVRGDRVVAFLVTDDWPVSLHGLARSKAPREVRRIDALPYTERGKLDRAALRRRLETPSDGAKPP